MNHCEIGGDCQGATQAHHDDYAQPLDVRWLCRRHHAEWHRLHGHAKNYHLRKQAYGLFSSPRQKFTVGDDLYAWIKEKAAQEDRSMSSMIRVLLYEAKYAEEARQLEASA